MNGAQKRYTVMQISKYKSEAEHFDKKAEINRWFVYGSIAVLFTASSIEGMEDISTKVELIADIIKFCGIYFGIDSFRRMIGNMAKKSGLENMATNLEYQMKNDALADDEEKSYKGRGL